MGLTMTALPPVENPGEKPGENLEMPGFPPGEKPGDLETPGGKTRGNPGNSAHPGENPGENRGNPRVKNAKE